MSLGSSAPRCPFSSPRSRRAMKARANSSSSCEGAMPIRMACSAPMCPVRANVCVCHRYLLMTKLKVHNTADLMRGAMRMGLIELEKGR